MATPDEVRTAVQHVQNCTGQEDAWQAGLTSTEVAIALVPSLAVVATPEQLDAILAKIHQQRPWLFDPSTGAPITPPGPAPDPPAPTESAPPADDRQSGAAAETMKDAEAALARLNSDVAEFDRQMLEAILQAHKTTEDGKKQLEQLEIDIENAVKTRKLDTPLGAREFQRYLIGKLNDILAVVAAENDL
ncbi:DUF4226 domain-containing protein, partial [Mycobacterium talmoniae]|uniref:DUF4226 domain-containing protein n=1 Tax=Mycobacterium talmoniae TaxID=1858794 RepID=UPI001058C7CD